MDSKFKFFQRLVAAPYLLALLGLLLPMMNVSCTDQIIAEPTFYEVANGVNLETSLKEPALTYLKKIQTGNPKALDKLKEIALDFPHLKPIPHLYALVGALVLAAIFALMSPMGLFASLGSLFMGILSMVALWALLLQMGQICNSLGMQVLQVEPGVGIYCASALIIIGTAMNLASIVRPIVVEIRARKKKS